MKAALQFTLNENAFSKYRRKFVKLLFGFQFKDNKFTRERTISSAITNLVTFLYRNDVTSDQSWGSKTIRVDGQTELIAAKNRLESRLRLWKRCNAEEDRKGSKHEERVCKTTFYIVAGAVTSRDLKGRGSYDPNIVEFGDNNFEQMREFIKKFPSSEELSKNLSQVQRFLKFEYGRHIQHSLNFTSDRSSWAITHCPHYALGSPAGSNPEGSKNKSVRKRTIIPKKWKLSWPDYDNELFDASSMSCVGCNGVFNMFDAVERNIMEAYDANQIPENLNRLRQFRDNNQRCMSHLLRCAVQQHKIGKIISDLHDTHAHVLMDFKMKLEEIRYRETTEQDFGKRGMSYHGCAIYVSKSTFESHFPENVQETGSNIRPYQVFFLDDVLAENQCQDAPAVACLLEAILIRLRRIFPTISTVSFQSDNAQCYLTPFISFIIPRLCKAHGLTATQFVHNESGDGKTILDSHFGVRKTQMIHDFVNEKHDVTEPQEVYDALTHQPVRNTMVNLVYLDLSCLELLSEAAKLCVVDGSSVVRQVNYHADRLDVYTYSDIESCINSCTIYRPSFCKNWTSI